MPSIAFLSSVPPQSYHSPTESHQHLQYEQIEEISSKNERINVAWLSLP
jgi:hypothetical protein